MSAQDQDLLGDSLEEVVFVDHGNHLLNKEDEDILNIDIDCEEDFTDQANNKTRMILGMLRMG